MGHFRELRGLHVELGMLFLVLPQEVLKVLMHSMQELIDLLHGRLGAMLVVLDLSHHLLHQQVSLLSTPLIVVVDLVQEYLADFDHLLVPQLVILIIGRHLKVGVHEISQLIDLMVIHDGCFTSLA